MPEVSIIMSVLNAEIWLEDSIESILNQTEKNFEFLIIDDGSEDNSLNILKKYEKKDERIKIETNKHSLGLTCNLNKLIKASKSNIIARMDADDISRPDRIKQQLEMMRKENLDLCFTQTNIILENGEVLCKKWFPNEMKLAFKYLPYTNLFTHSSLMINKKVYEENNLYNEEFSKSQDWELWMRLSKQDYKFGISEKILHNFRIHKKGSSASLSKSMKVHPSYFLARVLIFNKEKNKSLYFLKELSLIMLIKTILYLISPHRLILFFFYLNSVINKKSPFYQLNKKFKK